MQPSQLAWLCGSPRLGSRAREPAAATVKAIAAGSQQSTINKYQPSHRDFGRGADHHRKILDRACGCLDAGTFTGQRGALRLQTDQRCGSSLPLRIQPIPRRALLALRC